MLRTPTPLIAAITVTVVAAAFGFVAGHGHSSARAVPEQAVEASNGLASISYPRRSGWRRARVRPAIGGLAIEHELTLAPAGQAAKAGLILGQLGGGRPTLLPSAFLTRLTRSPRTEVVNLQNIQAYRYSQLSMPSPTRRLVLYLIPNSAASSTVLACYADVPSPSYMKACEQIAATVTLISATSEAQAGSSLTPDSNYARDVGAPIRHAAQLLATARAAMRPEAERPVIASLATKLSAGLARVTESLSAVPPPTSAAQVHAALLEVMYRLRTSYAELGRAASAGSVTKYDAARERAYAAGTDFRAVLESFALIGYG